MKKFSLVLLSTLVIAQTAAAAAPVKTTPADPTAGWKTAGDYFVGKGIFQQASGDPVVTRAELASALAALSVKAADLKGLGNCFSDVHQESFAAAACYAAKQQWISAMKDKTFQPSASATFGVALQAIVRSARLSAPATRGAWHVPFVNAAIREGIIDKADYTDVIDEPLTRGQLATMLYRLQLRGMTVSYPVGASCEPVNPVSASVVPTGKGSPPDLNIVLTDDKGKTCVIAHDPLSRVDAKHSGMQVLPLVPSIPDSNEGTSTPVVDKRAYFLSRDGNLWLPYVWELDLRKHTLRQILNAESPAAVRISPKYTFLTYVGSKGVDLRAMYIKTGLDKSIRRLTTQVTFLKSLTPSRSVKVTDHMLIDDNEALTFNVYNMRDGSLFEDEIRAQLDVLFNVRPSNK